MTTRKDYMPPIVEDPALPADALVLTAPGVTPVIARGLAAPPLTGRPIGRRTGEAATVSWTGRLPAEMLPAIREAAARRGMTVTAWVVEALRAALR